MDVSPLAGKPAEASMLANVPRLKTAYYTREPGPAVPEQRVAFGTSGHRGSAFGSAFNEAHILAITQAICLYRQQHGIDGPLFLGIDTHALSEAAFASALEVLAANAVDVMIDDREGHKRSSAACSQDRLAHVSHLHSPRAMLFANRCTWAHAIAAAARALGKDEREWLDERERDALAGRGDPDPVLAPIRTALAGS